jgi:hypothetical protein
MKKKDHDNPTPDMPGNSGPVGGTDLPEHDISDTGQWGQKWGQEWGPESAEEAISRVAALESELKDAKNNLLRTIADYQNSQRRALQNEQQAKADGVSRVVSDVATIVDHFDLALGQDPTKVSVDQLIGGVRVIREELIKILSRNGVTLIQPQPNDEFLPRPPRSRDAAARRRNPPRSHRVHIPARLPLHHAHRRTRHPSRQGRGCAHGLKDQTVPCQPTTTSATPASTASSSFSP